MVRAMKTNPMIFAAALALLSALIACRNGLWPRPAQSTKPRSVSRVLGLQVGSAFFFAAHASSVTPLAGQTITRLSPCTTCELTVSHVVSLGSALEPDSPADRPHRGVVHDARGRYFVKAGWPVSRILIYGSDGTLESVWGGRGEGPGEYGTIRRLMVLRGDSLGVLDGSVLRLTVLNADGSVARTQLLPINPYPHDMAQLDDGTLIVAGGEYTAAATGYIMHVIRPDGSASPLVPAGPILQFRPSAYQRRLVAAGMTVWAGRPDRYEVTEYATDGTPLRVLKREAEWFPDREVEGPMDPAREPAPPYLMVVHIDEEGLIWTLATVADPEWAPVEHVGLIVDERRRDTIVEVIDPDRGLVLRSQRFPWVGTGFTNDGLIVSERKADSGVTVLDVWRPEG